MLHVRERRLCAVDVGFSAGHLQRRAYAPLQLRAVQLQRLLALRDRAQRNRVLDVERLELEIPLRDVCQNREPHAASRLLRGQVVRFRLLGGSPQTAEDVWFPGYGSSPGEGAELAGLPVRIRRVPRYTDAREELHPRSARQRPRLIDVRDGDPEVEVAH